MNSFINTLSDTVLSRQFESCDLEELRTLSQKHPYSSAIQLLYAKKLKNHGDPGYPVQLQKTLLYYSNPLFIKHLIETEEQVSEMQVPRIDQDSNPVATDVKEPVTADDVMEPETIRVEQLNATKPGSELATELAIPELTESTATSEIASHSEEEAVLSEESAINYNKVDIEAVEDTDPAEEEEDEALPPLPQFKFEAIDPAKAELSFTPYHTIDYFAAQGIKLGDEQGSGDRFGTQLKSFTAWLKQMKRLPGATAKGNISVTEEKSIEQMAEQSLKGENADTEAMAQVWAQQGNAKKAIEIYKKLSLQIPAKSAYFAAKIDHLKK